MAAGRRRITHGQGICRRHTSRVRGCAATVQPGRIRLGQRAARLRGPGGLAARSHPMRPELQEQRAGSDGELRGGGDIAERPGVVQKVSSIAATRASGASSRRDGQA